MSTNAEAVELATALHDATLGRQPEAVDLALGDQVAMENAIEAVLAPIQREVGWRWERGVITNEQAHTVTDAIEDAVAVLWDAAQDLEASRGPHVAMACAPGEWHDLAARMAATVMRCEGCQVTMLGPSTGSDQLEEYARAERPVAIALSATLTSRLVAAARAVHLLHRAGTPVIVGGAAFGSDNTRARAIGADAWCPNGSTAAQTLRAWERHPPHVDTTWAANAPIGYDEAERAAIVDTALRTRLREEQERPECRTAADDHRAGVELAALLSFTEAAVVTGDDTVLTDGLTWWDRRITVDGAAPSLRSMSVDALVQALPPGRRRALLLRSRAELGTPAPRPAADRPQ